jgi:hypothetical protein
MPRHNGQEKQIPRRSAPRDDNQCHPERSEGSAFPKATRTGSVRAWSAALVAVLAIPVGFVLHCNEPNEDHAGVLRQAATQIVQAEHARNAAKTVMERARAGALAAEGEAQAVVSRAGAARARARVVGVDELMVSATPAAAPLGVRVPAPVVERMQLDSSALAALGTLVRWKDTVIRAQDRRIAADSLELIATSNAFNTLQQVKTPRCGRKCGIVLGIGGMLATAVAVEQVRRTIR